jgi:hypothetical protein
VNYYSWRVRLALLIAPDMIGPYVLGVHEELKREPHRLGLADNAPFLAIVNRMMELQAEGYRKIVLSPAHLRTAAKWQRQHDGVNSGPEAYALLHYLRSDVYELAK